MKVLFEDKSSSKQEILGSNLELKNVLPKSIFNSFPSYLKKTTFSYPDKNKPFSFQLPFGDFGNFYYSEKKQLLVISFSQMAFSSKDLIHATTLIAVLDISKGKVVNDFKKIIHHLAPSTSIRQNALEEIFAKSSNYAKTVVKSISLEKDFVTMVNKLEHTKQFEII